MARRDMEQYFEGLEAEFNAQRASTLGRFGRRLKEASIRCADQLANLNSIDGDDQELLVIYRETRTAFLEARSAFIFQREMLGLLEHHRVDEIFPIPPRR